MKYKITKTKRFLNIVDTENYNHIDIISIPWFSIRHIIVSADYKTIDIYYDKNHQFALNFNDVKEGKMQHDYITGDLDEGKY